ncbi:MAG: DUF1549 and DUF1553 domain-containing protein [Planctomycetaceae bacterium]
MKIQVILIVWFTVHTHVYAQPTDSAKTIPKSVAETAADIDQLFEAAWKRKGVECAPSATDEEFVRRLYLDLAGRIPAASETREFLRSTSATKRSELVERLLDGPAFVRHFTIVWRNALIPQAFNEPGTRGLVPGFEAWLWTHFSQGTPYDQMVRELLTTSIDLGENQTGLLQSASSPSAFFIVRQMLPENLATGTSRAFLGVRLDCAQCHDHPFDKWKHDQFWNMAAFYAGFQRPDAAAAADPAMMMNFRENLTAHSIQVPTTGNVVTAKFLTGAEPEWTDETAPRRLLADWITARDNPWFAAMAANRLWAQFMGQGIVQPIDDFSEKNPPSHPDVLNLLSEQFVAHHYDLKFLVRAITLTRVYQTTSRQTHASQSDPTQFARAALRGLTPEQFFDSLAEATGYYQPYRTDNPFVIDADTPRARFLELFRDETESPLMKETTILQALAMMNGDFIDKATTLDNSQTLRAVAEFPLMTLEEKLNTLFVAALSRSPTDSERVAFEKFLADGGTDGNPQKALADVFWALLNSSEFLLNH